MTSAVGRSVSVSSPQSYYGALNRYTSPTVPVGVGRAWDPESKAMSLTRRELHLIFGVARGRSNAEIGQDLGLEENTVKTHVRRIFLKNRNGDRAELVTWCYRYGLLYRLKVDPLPTPGPVYLSNREREVIRGIIAGLTNKQIGDRIFLSEHTIKSHLKNLVKKIGARNRAHVVTLAWQHKPGTQGSMGRRGVRMRQERDHEPDPNYAEKRRAAKFQQGRWSLYVTFDPVAAQFSGGYGREFEEAWKFCMWVARNFGGPGTSSCRRSFGG